MTSLNKLSDEGFIIRNVKARWILDSRGNPTVEVEVITAAGFVGRAATPSGKTRGRYEAIEIRDVDDPRFKGRGVFRAVEIVNTEISPLIIGMDSRNQREIDYAMIKYDGTRNKSKVGANAMVATSLAVAKAAARTYGVPLYRYLGKGNTGVLPTPIMNILNGGPHAGNELAIPEFMIVPVNADSFSEALRMGVEVYYSLREVLLEKYGRIAVNVGDEGGFAPPMRLTKNALDALMLAIERAGYSEEDLKLGMDCAASTFYDEREQKYFIDGKSIGEDGLMEYYLDILNSYPIIYLEDPFHEEAFEAFSEITKKAKNTLIIGDDLFVTNPERLRRGIDMNACNAILIKVNQIGTLTETIDVVNIAKKNNYKTIISHRSGETEDTSIADISVGLSTGLIKAGAPARGERTAKYNQLLRIEEELGSSAIFLGLKAFR